MNEVWFPTTMDSRKDEQQLVNMILATEAIADSVSRWWKSA